MPKTYTVTKYDSEDIEKLKHMTNEEVVEVLKYIKRGWLPQTYIYGTPDEYETYTEEQYENTRLHRAIQKAIDVLQEKKGE